MDATPLGKEAKRRREELNLSIREVAAAAGVGSGTLSDLENGRSKSCTYLAELAIALNHRAEKLAAGERPDADSALERELSPRETRLIKAFRALKEPGRAHIESMLHFGNIVMVEPARPKHKLGKKAAAKKSREKVVTLARERRSG